MTRNEFWSLSTYKIRLRVYQGSVFQTTGFETEYRIVEYYLLGCQACETSNYCAINFCCVQSPKNVLSVFPFFKALPKLFWETIHNTVYICLLYHNYIYSILKIQQILCTVTQESMAILSKREVPKKFWLTVQDDVNMQTDCVLSYISSKFNNVLH